jgi:hypothetical protein
VTPLADVRAEVERAIAAGEVVRPGPRPQTKVVPIEAARAPSPTARASFCTNGPSRAECGRPSAAGKNPLGLCPEHLAAYQKHLCPGGAGEDEHVGERGGLSALPQHDPCGASLGVPEGDGMALRCAVVRTHRLAGIGANGAKFYEHIEAEGCGRIFELCPLHGLRSCPCGVAR